jgi:DNA-binding transcriptional regulator YiaG
LLDVVVRRNAAVLRALADPMTEGWRHIDCGLDYVHLVNGYEFRETDDEPDISIQRLDELHAVIARAIIASSLPLRGQELRFLRSVLRLSPAGLALATHLSKAAVERWEAEPDSPAQVLPGAHRRRDRPRSGRVEGDALQAEHERLAPGLGWPRTRGAVAAMATLTRITIPSSRPTPTPLPSRLAP